MKNKKYIFAILCFLLILLVSGCGQPKAVTVTVWERMEPEAQMVFDKLATEFMEANPHIIIVHKYDTMENLEDNIEQAISEKKAPDLVYLNKVYVGRLYERNLIVPVTEFVSQEFINSFNSIAIESGSIKGIPYSLPYIIGNDVSLIYNKQYVKEAPETWDDLVRAALSVRHNTEDYENAVYGFLTNEEEPYWFTGIYHAFGGRVFDDNYNPTLNNKAMVQALQFTKDITQEYGIGFPGMSLDDIINKFNSENAGMVFMIKWFLPEYKNTGIDFGVAPMPLLPNGERIMPYSDTSGFCIIAERDGHKNEAITEFLEFLFKPENNAMFAVASMMAPTITAAAQTATIKDDEYQSYYLSTINYTIAEPCVVEYSEIRKAIDSELKLVLVDNKDPAEAAEAMQQKAEEGIERNTNK